MFQVVMIILLVLFQIGEKSQFCLPLKRILRLNYFGLESFRGIDVFYLYVNIVFIFVLGCIFYLVFIDKR